MESPHINIRSLTLSDRLREGRTRAGAVNHGGETLLRVLDQGAGFEPLEVADPLAPENVLKSSGRGIFFMRSFMDDVSMRRIPGGGMSVRMCKKLAS